MSTPFVDADYAAIEARIVAWLAGQDDVLREYVAYDAAATKEEKWLLSPYVLMASSIFQVSAAQVNKFPQRFVGKESVLGCGFGLGPPKFRVTCKKKGYDLPMGLEFTAIEGWRAKHNRIVKWWTILDKAAKNAVIKKGEVFKAGEHITFKCMTTGDVEYLLMRLPSGRKLAYPWPKIIPGKFEGSTAVSFYQNLKGKTWGHNHGVWGGVWAENATQAVAADIMAHGAHNAERHGYEIATLIHDQALAYYHAERGQSAEEFERLLVDLPAWAEGLPLAAEGGLTPFYRKD